MAAKSTKAPLKAANTAKAPNTAKTREPKADPNFALKGMANKIMESGQQIWLAGLGAFAKAQEEGGKLYESLIKEGSALEKITTKYTSGKVDEVRGAVENTVSQVKDRASDTWDKLEKVFEERVSRALGGLGIPGREEINNLAAKVDELSKAVKAMSKAPPTANAPAAKSATAKAPAAKATTSAKSAPAKKAASATTAQSVQETVVDVAKKVQARASSAVANASKSAQSTVERASKAAQAAVKTVTDAVTDATGG